MEKMRLPREFEERLQVEDYQALEMYEDMEQEGDFMEGLSIENFDY
jgi:hypothetical protein